MTKEQQQTIDSFLQKMRNILIKKGHDYSGKQDTLQNFYISEVVGVLPEKGLLVRILDKINRVSNFIDSDILLVKDEKIEDTLIDLANYAVLLHLLIKQQRERQYK